MAFITAERTKEIKQELAKKFPNLKFSVRNMHHSEVLVTIVSGNVDFSDILDGHNGYVQLNHYYLNKYGNHGKLLEKIKNIANQGNYDRSDAMTDYFDVGFYLSIHIGAWDKPYKKTT